MGEISTLSDYPVTGNRVKDDEGPKLYIQTGSKMNDAKR